MEGNLGRIVTEILDDMEQFEYSTLSRAIPVRVNT